MNLEINPEANEIDESDLQAAADLYDRLVTVDAPKIDVRHLVELLVNFDDHAHSYDDAIGAASEAAEIASELLGLLIGLDDDQLGVIDPNERLVL